MPRKTLKWLQSVIDIQKEQISKSNVINKDLKTQLEGSKTQIDALKKDINFQQVKTKESDDLLTERDRTISEQTKALFDKDKEIKDYQKNISDRDTNISDLNKVVWEKDIEIDEYQKDISDRDKSIWDLNTTIWDKDKEIKNLKASLKEFEVRKFALAFESEKKEYWSKVDVWRPIAVRSFILLLFTTVIITIVSFQMEGLDKISLIFIESIVVFFAWFSIKQYLYYTSHYSDALRRQTLSQWYQYILSWWEDQEIEPEYKEKLVNVLCDNEKKENKYTLPQEKIITKLTDLTESLTKLIWKQ